MLVGPVTGEVSLFVLSTLFIFTKISANDQLGHLQRFNRRTNKNPLTV